MSILTIPATPGLRTSTWGHESAVQRFPESPLTGNVQVKELPGSFWYGTYVLPTMPRARAAAWQAWGMKQRGGAVFFYGYDPDARTPRGAAGGTPLINGAGQTGASLVTDGWPASTAILLAGDYLAYDVTGGAGRQLHMAVADATTDAGGVATLSIEPPIRTSPADNEPLILTDASCVMHLVNSRVEWDADQISRYGMAFDVREIF